MGLAELPVRGAWRKAQPRAGQVIYSKGWAQLPAGSRLRSANKPCFIRAARLISYGFPVAFPSSRPLLWLLFIICAEGREGSLGQRLNPLQIHCPACGTVPSLPAPEFPSCPPITGGVWA